MSAITSPIVSAASSSSNVSDTGRILSGIMSQVTITLVDALLSG